jgi:hypothetical protein
LRLASMLRRSITQAASSGRSMPFHIASRGWPVAVPSASFRTS